MKKLIDVYPYRLQKGEPQFLLLKRSSEKIYAHQWRMIGGKVKADEAYWKAALRELQEETGLIPVKFWVIPSVNHFYEPQTDQILMIPAFAAEIKATDPIKLDEEHHRYEWVPVDEVRFYINWPEQRRLIQLTFDILTDNKLEILPEWNINIP